MPAAGPRTPSVGPRPVGERAGADRCPGTLRLHPADDGHVARIRIPGGRLRPAQMRVIGCAATELGDGCIQVTSRGNLQIRGLPPDAGQGLADRLYAAGLLPSPAHDRARNVLASPLSGLDGDAVAPVDPVLAELDRLLCASPALTGLSGRFLFALDDGRGDVLALGPDLAAVSESPSAMRLWVGPQPTLRTAPPARAAAMLIAAARRFLEVRSVHAPQAWRCADLGPAAGRVAPPAAGVTSPAGGCPPLGLIGSDGTGRSVSAALRLGRTSAEAWSAVAGVADRAAPPGGDPPVRVTPWRGVVVGGLSPEAARRGLAVLGAAGLVVDAAAPLARVSTCAGRPGCAAARSDVRADAVAAFGDGDRAYPVHVSGCERRCGHPEGNRVEAVATGEGRYTVQRHPAGLAIVVADVPLPDLADAVGTVALQGLEGVDGP